MGLLGALRGRRLTILIFHRVHARADPLFPGEPDAQRFRRIARYLRRTFKVLSLGDAAMALARRELPARALVITFDDGYADNAEVALPILREHGLTATFFVSTGFLDGGRMWNDTVIECVRRSSRADVDLACLGLGCLPLGNLDERRTALETILRKVKYLDLAGREQVLPLIQRAFAVEALPSDLMMRSDQVRLLHRSGMEIGGHTVHHPILAALPVDAATSEIAQGKQRLEAIVQAPVEVFAYPNGKPHQDYRHEHVQAASRLGFRAAVSTAPGAAGDGADPYQLPRFTPWDASMLAWSMRLAVNAAGGGYETVPVPAQPRP